MAFPVVACTTSTGRPLASQADGSPPSCWHRFRPPWSARWSSTPTACTPCSARRLVLLADGREPGGHRAGGLSARHLHPPVAGTIPAAGSEGIFATFADTGNRPGHRPGVPVLHHSLVAAGRGALLGQQAGRRADIDAHPRRRRRSPTRPASPGHSKDPVVTMPVTGAVIFPQSMPAVTDGSSVDVAVESCSLTDDLGVPDHPLRLRGQGVPGAGVLGGTRAPYSGR